MRYILVKWPESQKYQDNPECFLAFTNAEFKDITMDGAYFVPENIYCKTEGTLHPFFKTVTNGELQDILSQYPKDATVAVEYCDVKNLKYFPDRNFIAID